MNLQGGAIPMPLSTAARYRRISGLELERTMLEAIRAFGPISFDQLLVKLEEVAGGWVDDVEAQELLWNAIARGELLVSQDLTLRRQA